MGSTKQGLRYEHDLKNDIYERTLSKDRVLVPIRPDFSGNSLPPNADLVVNDGRRVHAIELKRTGKDVFRIPGYEIEQLVQFCQEYPAPAYPYLGVRFNQRQLVLTKVWMGDGGDNSYAEDAALMCPVEAHATEADTFVIQKPSTEEWPSVTKGDDVEHVLDTIGYYGVGEDVVQGVDVSSLG
jgi:Holliday junction resolvase